MTLDELRIGDTLKSCKYGLEFTVEYDRSSQGFHLLTQAPVEAWQLRCGIKDLEVQS